MTPQLVLEAGARFARDVSEGLTKPGQKELPSKYLYDAIGSQLFEVITLLPEYGVTRSEERLLSEHAEWMMELVPGDVTVAELGCGSGKKTRYLLRALASRRAVTYRPIEISPDALLACRRELADMPGVQVMGSKAEYLDGLRTVSCGRRPGEKLLVMFLGSSIGNFEDAAAVAFLKSIRRMLRPGDFLLLGTDLRKPVQTLLLAYDDPLGVTAAFNLNLLGRINRELGGNFDLGRFRHEAHFNASTGSVEMHLKALVNHTVTIREGQLEVHFREGETIWTESSHKYTPGEVLRLGQESGFALRGQWIEEVWGFAETLFAA